MLFQLPPKLAFDAGVAEDFLSTVRELTAGRVALEPRHASWFSLAAGDLLKRHEVARVAADPARVPAAARPGGWAAWRYYRLHGSPRTYYTPYDATQLEAQAEAIGQARGEVWCVFDNTASGAAIWNATQVRDLLALERTSAPRPRTLS